MFDNINTMTGFANGERFTSAAQVREYFTNANMLAMGLGALPEADLSAWADEVIANRWHMETVVTCDSGQTYTITSGAQVESLREGEAALWVEGPDADGPVGVWEDGSSDDDADIRPEDHDEVIAACMAHAFGGE